MCVKFLIALIGITGHMAGLAHGALQSNGPSVSVVTLKILPTPWQFAVVGAIFILVIIARLSSCTEYLRGLVQPFVLRRVESGVPVILAIQVPSAH